MILNNTDDIPLAGAIRLEIDGKGEKSKRIRRRGFGGAVTQHMFYDQQPSRKIHDNKGIDEVERRVLSCARDGLGPARKKRKRETSNP